MAIEHALARAVPKPWGVEDLRPWSTAHHGGGAIGEIWYERAGVGYRKSFALAQVAVHEPTTFRSGSP